MTLSELEQLFNVHDEIICKEENKRVEGNIVVYYKSIFLVPSFTTGLSYIELLNDDDRIFCYDFYQHSWDLSQLIIKSLHIKEEKINWKREGF